MKLSILKCHGSGNDFVLIDETLESNSNILHSQRADLTRTICNRENGVGADGILFYQSSKVADCKMRMFNPDGGEAEMCGNGLRCVGRYCSERQMKSNVAVETMKSILNVKRGAQIYNGIETFEADIGPVSTHPGTLPMSVDSESFIGKVIDELSPELEFTALTVPNPHIITIVDEIDEALVQNCGYRANNSRLFPKGVNVSFVTSLGNNIIYVVTYERGVGITYSCGTAMSASAYVSVLRGITKAETEISVFNKGGMVKCDVKIQQGENIILKGNATFVFEAELQIGSQCKKMERQFDSKVRTDEISAYGALQEYAESVLKK
uniref:Diaminopimelate epimerase n=1 Tax=Candidatus Kentrum sp. MB TaxID=2138164 RepID=A0A451BFN4_9GAMM|nr:MAG: diaminopimelate epimerase [Candidatus Kentron sp. MB]VFK34989.1 MAG: diaminopimelate epimerase [Candidatus Kentron sp. MB]VFK77093.1 MAG: diaminopimelate epimerase [Candidatus Kentron sp. MB]